MPSLNDIPEELLQMRNIDKFIKWLSDTPADFNHKRSIANLWSKATGVKLLGEHYEKLKHTALPPG